MGGAGTHLSWSVERRKQALHVGGMGMSSRSPRVLGQAGCIERVRGGTVPGGVREEIGKHARHYDIRTLHP